MTTSAKLTALAGAAALALPALAIADPGGQPHQPSNKPGTPHGQSNAQHGKAKGKGKSLVFKGTLTSVGTDAATVNVTGGNKAAKNYVKAHDASVDFDLSKAKIVADDTNADGQNNEQDDLKTGDKVNVKVRLAKGQSATEPLAARQLVDQTRSSSQD